MNIKKTIRIAITLVLTFALLFSVAAPASAAMTGLANPAFAPVPAPLGVDSVLKALGIEPGADAMAYENVVNDCVSFLKESGKIVGETIPWLGILSGEPAVRIGYAPSDLVQNVLEWAFNFDVVPTPPVASFTTTLPISFGDGEIVFETNKPVYLLAYRYKDATFGSQRFTMGVCALESFTYTRYIGGELIGSGTSKSGNSAQGKTYYVMLDYIISEHPDQAAVMNTYPDYGYASGAYEHVHNAVFPPETDLNIGSAESPFVDGVPVYFGSLLTYMPWAERGVSVPLPGTDEDKEWVPVGLGSGMTDQSSAQSGVVTDDTLVWEETETGSGTDTGTGTGTTTLSDILAAIKAIPDKFAGWFADVISWGQKIWESVVALPQAIGQTIADALSWAFAPADTFIQTKVEALISKYPASENLFLLGSQLKDFFLNLGQTPPVIYINLGAAEGSYHYGGTIPFLDLTWYSRYKPTMDSILGGFLWLWFAWRVWLKLPGILEGVSGEAGRLMTRREINNDN